MIDILEVLKQSKDHILSVGYKVGDNQYRLDEDGMINLVTVNPSSWKLSVAKPITGNVYRIHYVFLFDNNRILSMSPTRTIRFRLGNNKKDIK